MCVYVYRNKEYVLRDTFDIKFKQTPVVYMLHRGHMYKYLDDLHDQDALIDFAIETFHDSEHKT